MDTGNGIMMMIFSHFLSDFMSDAGVAPHPPETKNPHKKTNDLCFESRVFLWTGRLISISPLLPSVPTMESQGWVEIIRSCNIEIR